MLYATGTWVHGFHRVGGWVSWRRSLLMLLSALCKRVFPPWWNEGLWRATATEAEPAGWGSTCCPCLHAPLTQSPPHARMHARMQCCCQFPVLCAVATGLTAHTTVHHALCTRSRQTDSETVAGTETHSVGQHRWHLLVTGT